MPTYDYVCAACGHALEIFQSMSESPKKKCPKCGKSKLERRIGAGAGFLFKGSGFYLTDYRSKAYTQASEAERKQASGAVSSTDGASTTPALDAKPAASGDSTTKHDASPKPATVSKGETASKKSTTGPSSRSSSKKPKS